MARWLPDLFGGSRKRKGAAYASLLKRYDAYIRLLRANNDFLESLAEVEAMRSAGGVCGWDRLGKIATGLNVQVFAMARMLGRLSDGRYDGLFPVIEEIGREMEGLLGRRPAPDAEGPLVAALGETGAGCERLLGGKAAHLASFSGAGACRVPEGLVVTTRAFGAFLEQSGLDEMARMLWDTLDPEDPAHLLETSQALRTAVLAAALPAPAEAELREALLRLGQGLPAGARFAVRSSANGEDSSFSFAGQYDTFLDVPGDEVPSAVVKVFASFFNPSPVMLRLRRGFGALELGMAALVTAMVRGRVSGVAYSRDPSAREGELARVEAVPGAGTKLAEGAARPSGFALDRRSGALAGAWPGADSGDAGGAPLLSEGDLGRILGIALAAEETLRAPADVEWTVDAAGELWLLQLRPLALRPSPGRSAEPVPGFRVLLEGGTPVSAGAASGPVTHIGGPEDAAVLPAWSVAVVAEALPELALLLPRACALVAERGGAASHLAAVAREFGVPAVFSLEGALAALPPGRVVTVDAVGGRVYEGEVGLLLEGERPVTSLATAASPVGDAVRGLLALVEPLNLLDPASPQFAPSGCRSLHDVVRFIHEKALFEMARLLDSVQGGSCDPGLRIREELPFDLRLLPLGSGVEGPAEESRVSIGQVTSVPARAILAGLSDPAVRRRGPRPVDASGLLSVISGSLGADPELGLPGWAIVSDRYLHLSSRIGYHFTTVEAFAGRRAADNRIRFAFKGGAADPERRQRRARFLAGALEGLGFQTRQKSDFVSASFGQAGGGKTVRVLEEVGRLLACAGQLDMALAQEGQVRWYVEGFLAGDYARILEAERPAKGGG